MLAKPEPYEGLDTLFQPLRDALCIQPFLWYATTTSAQSRWASLNSGSIQTNDSKHQAGEPSLTRQEISLRHLLALEKDPQLELLPVRHASQHHCYALLLVPCTPDGDQPYVCLLHSGGGHLQPQRSLVQQLVKEASIGTSEPAPTGGAAGGDGGFGGGQQRQQCQPETLSSQQLRD
ncbi:unnamed protein product [Closterium sp. NIES-54]